LPPSFSAASSGKLSFFAGSVGPGWRTTSVPSLSVSSSELPSPSWMAEYMPSRCCSVTMAVTTPANAPPGPSMRRDTTSPGMPSVRVVIGSLMKSPVSRESRCAVKYGRSDTSDSGPPVSRERWRCMPWASTMVSTLTCGTPTVREARPGDTSPGPKSPLAAPYQLAVSRSTTSTACMLRSDCSASALARLPSSRSLASMICWCSRQPS
jgi:hypothetical protein